MWADGTEALRARDGSDPDSQHKDLRMSALQHGDRSQGQLASENCAARGCRRLARDLGHACPPVVT